MYGGCLLCPLYPLLLLLITYYNSNWPPILECLINNNNNNNNNNKLLIMPCFKRKDCLQRNLYLFKASDIVWSVSISAVIWSNVLISVTLVELLWAVYKFFRINNIDLIVGYLTSCDIYTNTLHLLTRLIFNTNKIWETFSPCGHGPARTPIEWNLAENSSTQK